MAIDRSLWGSDVPVSAPVLPEGRSADTLRVPMQGLGFEPTGIVFDIDETQWQDIYLPRYAPQDLT